MSVDGTFHRLLLAPVWAPALYPLVMISPSP